MPRIRCRLMAIDLDGTLLNSQHRLSDQDRDAVREIARRGVHVVLASGRMYRTILPFSQQIGLRDPIISYNGALVKDTQTETVLYHLPIPWEIAAKLIDWCVQRGLHLHFYVNDELYVRELNQWTELYDRRTGAQSRAIGDLRRLKGPEPTKMQLLDTPERIDELYPTLVRWSQGRLAVIHTQPEYIEFVHPEVSKGRALMALSRRLDISREETVAFGDGPNDQNMLEVAGFSVVMGNAPDTIKAHADYITASNDEAGVAHAIRALFL